MGNAKRWTVTYTKHIKQKRKVYQDGFLHLHDSTNKVMLYDLCDKLLECRLLKKYEIVTSGETLEFNGYLVDIGDPDGDSSPISVSIDDRADKNISGGPNRSSGSKSRIPSGDNWKINLKEKKAPHALSPSQKIIKEFKKRELLKYGSPKISPETTKPTTSEWQVLYTTQMTQKAKRYHDGFLQQVICGSRGRQVMLFDASRKLLDSRFLKQNDVIRVGESFAFNAYLVDIGESQGNQEPDSSVLRNKCTDAEGIRKMHGQQCLDTRVTAGKSEWQVVYAARSTKKTKKFHDGFLRVEICGSQVRKVVLCDLRKTPIEHRILKKNEVIRPGESVYFDGHFVDVGDPERSHQSPINIDEQGTDQKVIKRRQIKEELNGCLKANSSVVKGIPYCKAYLAKELDSISLFSGSEVMKPNRTVPPIKSLRDTQQILSILQNRAVLESNVTGGRQTTASAPNLSSSDNLHDRESVKAVKSPNIVYSKDCAAASGGASLLVGENIGTSHQPYSRKEAQTNMSDADIVFSVSSSGAHSSCVVTCEDKSDEFSFKRDMNEGPSFALGL